MSPEADGQQLHRGDTGDPTRVIQARDDVVVHWGTDQLVAGLVTADS
jgi:hypothetical protein